MSCVNLIKHEFLVKGSAGAAIQNMNLMQGFEETMGISVLPIYP